MASHRDQTIAKRATPKAQIVELEDTVPTKKIVTLRINLPIKSPANSPAQLPASNALAADAALAVPESRMEDYVAPSHAGAIGPGGDDVENSSVNQVNPNLQDVLSRLPHLKPFEVSYTVDVSSIAEAINSGQGLVPFQLLLDINEEKLCPRSKLQDLVAQLEDESAENRRATQEAASKHEARIRELADGWNKSTADYEAQLKALRVTTKSDTTDCEAQVKELTDMSNKLQAKNKEFEGQVEALQKDLKEHRLASAATQKQLVDSSRAELTNQKSTYEARIRELQKSIGALQEESDAKTTTIMENLNHLYTMKVEQQKLKRQREDEEAAIDNRLRGEPKRLVQEQTENSRLRSISMEVGKRLLTRIDMKMKRTRTKRMPSSAVSVVYTTTMMEEE